ncbi:hypothetical protein BJV74DRAFT_798678 [Russula compacta]|nr:hypothetical protein BJV74DRAFT_798678 [Russula compacta]
MLPCCGLAAGGCISASHHKTASQLVSRDKANIAPESKPPINAQQGLLFEWWSIFWVLFQAKNSGSGSEDAIMYHKHQNQMRAQAGHVPHPSVAQPPLGWYPLLNGMTGPVPPLPNTQINGIGFAGQPLSLTAPYYSPSNPTTHPNGIPPPPAPPGAQDNHFWEQEPILSVRGNNSQQWHTAGPMAQLNCSLHMSAINRTAMPPPNGPQHLQGPPPAAAGSAHLTLTMAYQQLGCPPSSHGTSSHLMNPHISPALELMGEAKQHASLGGKDAQSLALEEKFGHFHLAVIACTPRPMQNMLFWWPPDPFEQGHPHSWHNHHSGHGFTQAPVGLGGPVLLAACLDPISLGPVVLPSHPIPIIPTAPIVPPVFPTPQPIGPVISTCISPIFLPLNLLHLGPWPCHPSWCL